MKTSLTVTAAGTTGELSDVYDFRAGESQWP